MDQNRERGKGKQGGLNGKKHQELQAPDENWPPGPWPAEDWTTTEWTYVDEENAARGASEHAAKARAELNPDQIACIDQLPELFPLGFVFCTPAREKMSTPPSEQNHHILFTPRNLERMWEALYDYLAPKEGPFG